MKNIKLVIMLFFLISSMMYAVSIAKVGDYYIKESELERRMKQSESSDPSSALEEIITEKLILSFAKENQIEIDDVELDQYFMSIFQNEPDFVNDGAFDYSKYLSLKDTPKIKRILNVMRDELTIAKAKEIIMQMISPSEAELNAEIFASTATLDVSFAIIDKDLVNIPIEYNSKEAIEFYQKNKDKYQTPKKIKLDFVIIDADDIESKPKPDSVYFYKGKYFLYDYEFDDLVSLDSLEIVMDSIVVDSVYFDYENNRTYEFAKEKANDIYNKLLFGDEIYEPILQSDWLEEIDNLGKLPYSNALVRKAFDYEVDEFLPIFEFGRKFVIVKVSDIQEPRPYIDETNKKQIWLDYIKWKEENRNINDYKNYYYTHLNEFQTDIALVEKIYLFPEKLKLKLNFSDTELKKFYENNPEMFTRLGQLLHYDDIKSEVKNKYMKYKRNQILNDLKNKLINHNISFDDLDKNYKNAFTKEVSTIYLRNVLNQNSIDNKIAKIITDGSSMQYDGFLFDNNNFISFKVLTVFENYFPDFEDVKQNVFEKVEYSEVNFDSSYYRKYYDEHIDKFFTEDSIQIAGAFFRFEPDSVQVDEYDLKDYYNNHYEEFYRRTLINYDFIFIHDDGQQRGDFVNKVYDKVLSGIDFDLLKEAYSSPSSYDEKKILSLDEFPREFKKEINVLRLGELSKPVYYKNGWYIIKILNVFEPRYLTFDEAKPIIKSKLQDSISKKIAYNKAKTVFDSTSYPSQIYKYADSTEIFISKMEPLNSYIKPIGNLTEYRDIFLRMSRNEKLNRIISTKDGYGVCFLKKRKFRKQMSFEESYDLIKKYIEEDRKYSYSKNYVEHLKDAILKGENPDSLLYFLGGWQRLKDLNKDSKIANLEYSDLLINDILQRDSGYISHIMKLSNGNFFFYKVNSIKRISEKDLKEERKSIIDRIIKNRFEKWRTEYAAKVGVIRF